MLVTRRPTSPSTTTASPLAMYVFVYLFPLLLTSPFLQSDDDVVHVRLSDLVISSPDDKRALVMRLSPDVIKRYNADTAEGKEITVDWRRLPSERTGLMAMMRILHMSEKEMATSIAKLNDALLDVRLFLPFSCFFCFIVVIFCQFCLTVAQFSCVSLPFVLFHSNIT